MQLVHFLLTSNTMLHWKDSRVNRKSSGGIKNKDGEVETDKENILARWAEFYEELYSDNPVSTNIDDSHEDPIPEILKCEVEKAINELKIEKAQV